MRHLDPDFAELPPASRRTIACSLVCGTGGYEALTPTQKQLASALSHSLLGLDVNLAKLPHAEPEDLASALEGAPPEAAQRVAQLLLIMELILDPLPREVAESVERYAAAIGVRGDLMNLGRDYAEKAYGLALKDIERKGYFSDFSGNEMAAKRMHVHGTLKRPFEVVDHDIELEREWKALENCATGTLGRAIWEFYVGRGFVFPGSPGSVSPTLAQHDWVHVLADFGTVIESELEVFAFIAAAIPDPKGFSFLAAILGIFETGRIKEGAGGVLQASKGHLEVPGMPVRVADALRRGRVCHRDVVYGVDYFDYVNLPLEEARKSLSIPPKDEEAIAAGSAGVNDAAGITAYQREHGDPRFQPAR